ncbi:serine hydrolase domain-containing protein [Herbiconiux sp. A18JL235]|uniref:Serine hydrolase domain-containing protein n=1 Tax=Herbiconiux sp. A18JL235 TaxID=3152363 RepID=A0AB39BGL5_9MICO
MNPNHDISAESASSGAVAPGFEAVRDRLDRYLADEPLYSAQLAVFWRGELIVDLVGGPDMAADSLTGVFSVSKGAGAAAISILVESGQLDLEQRVAHYWPEFAKSGKEGVLVRQLLSHQAGLLGVDERMSLDDFLDSEVAAARLARERPLWRPGSAFGYHGLTIGVFMEELVRRITGESLQSLYEREVRGPRDIDFFLGLPESEEPRYRDVLPMAPTEQQAAELAAQPRQPDGMAMLMFNSSRGIAGADISPNQRVVRAAGASAFGAVASGRGLAEHYAAVLGHVGTPFLSPETNRIMSQQQSWGIDRCFGDEHCFATVYQCPSHRVPFGSYRAFGHDGAGGALGFADPLHDLSFGYVPARMAYPGGVDPKAVELSRIVRAALPAEA